MQAMQATWAMELLRIRRRDGGGGCFDRWSLNALCSVVTKAVYPETEAVAFKTDVETTVLAIAHEWFEWIILPIDCAPVTDRMATVINVE